MNRRFWAKATGLSLMILTLSACRSAPGEAVPEVGLRLAGDFISPDMPDDLNPGGGGAPTATLDQAARFAWREFIALNWPAASAARDQPSSGRLGDPGPWVWSTFRARVELFPGIGKPHGANDAGPDYGYDQPPRYRYDPAKVGAPAGGTAGEIAACQDPGPGSAPAPAPWHNLDEPNHNNLRSGLSPEQPFPGQQILLESKVNRENYVYVVSRGWYGDKSTRRARKKTGLYVRRNLAAPPAGLADDPDDREFISFPVHTMELKAAWRRLGARDNPARYLSQPVRYYQSREGGYCYRDSSIATGHRERWGVLALHIMRKTASAPYFIWATFEHVDNLVARVAGADGVAQPLERPDGTPRSPFGQIYFPDIKVIAATEETDQEIRVGEDGKPADPGLGLYYQQEGLYEVQPVARIAVQGRLYPAPHAIARINAAIQKRLARDFPGSPLRYYRLVAVQWRPLDKPPGQAYAGDADPAIYYAANVIIEPQPVHQSFSGQFTHGFTKASDYLHRDLLFLNPRPNPGAPVFLNSFYGGQGVLAGGCMGCHGSRQAYGTDWSFLLYRQRVTNPEVKP